MSPRSRNWFILLTVTALTLIADRVTKIVVANSFSLYETRDPPIAFLRHVFSFTYTTNTGAAFGLFPDHGIVFVIIAFAVVAAIIYYYRHLPVGYYLVRLALGLQLGGALGNLIDRLRQGYVIDFVDFNFWPLQDWAVFNVADSAIVVGVCLLAIVMLREDIYEQDTKTSLPESDTASEPGTSS